MDQQPYIEEILGQHKGLMSKLFLHVCNRKKLKRKVTFVDLEVEEPPMMQD